MDPLSPTLADGGLATLLQRAGLPPLTPVDGWLRDHPERVLEAHRAFVQAGSELLVAGSFRLLEGLAPDWRALSKVALSVAREAAETRPVWASIGPWRAAWSEIGPEGRDRATRGWSEAAQHHAPLCDGLLLETFTELPAGLAALGASAGCGAPVVLSFSVRPDGALYDGTGAREAALAALHEGAHAVGFNCGEGPLGVAAAVRSTELGALWARPAARPDAPDEPARLLGPLLDQCSVIGGCCGAGPQTIRALGALR